MLRYVFLLIALTIVLFWSSCRKDFDYQTNTGQLEFSKDTVFLDTVFNSISTATYSFKVYNRGEDDINIPLIQLANGLNSGYRLNVDGIAGKEFKNTPIFAKDSLYIFIETTVDISENEESEFIYTDAIQFTSTKDTQQVTLVTLIKDAIFLYPKTLSNGTKEQLVLGSDENGEDITTEGFVLNQNDLHFTNKKPYVIYGYAAVPEGKTLVIDAGSNVYFHQNSGIIVSKGASLDVKGELSTDENALENQVTFSGDQLKKDLKNIPGQWGTIWLAPGSVNNKINYLTIKNATVGLLAEGNNDSPTLMIKNSQIYNSSSVNLSAIGANIIAENLILGNAGESSLRINLGGSYSFTHCTIANYWNHSYRATPTLSISNYKDTNDTLTSQDLKKAEFTNCIIDGNNNQELLLNHDSSAQFNYTFKYTAIKFIETNDTFLDGLNDSIHYDQIFLNSALDFYDPSRNDFRIGSASEIIGKGNLEKAQLTPIDILGISRIIAPEIGAYEYQE